MLTPKNQMLCEDDAMKMLGRLDDNDRLHSVAMHGAVVKIDGYTIRLGLDEEVRIIKERGLFGSGDRYYVGFMDRTAQNMFVERHDIHKIVQHLTNIRIEQIC